MKPTRYRITIRIVSEDKYKLKLVESTLVRTVRNVLLILIIILNQLPTMQRRHDEIIVTIKFLLQMSNFYYLKKRELKTKIKYKTTKRAYLALLYNQITDYNVQQETLSS